MTCYLTSRDDRFAAAVDRRRRQRPRPAWAARRDDAHYLACVRARRHAVGGPRALRRMSPFTQVEQRAHPDAGHPGRGRHPLPGRPGRAVAHRTARTRRADAAGALPGRLTPVHPLRAAVAPDRLQPPGGRLGRAVCRRCVRPAPSTYRRRALATSPGRVGAAAPRARRATRHPASARRWRGRARDRGARGAQPRHRRRGRPPTRSSRSGRSRRCGPRPS